MTLVVKNETAVPVSVLADLLVTNNCATMMWNCSLRSLSNFLQSSCIVKAILETFDKIDTKAKGTKKSAAPENLFIVQKECKKLDKERSDQFHSIVAQVMFTTKHDRPDTGTAVSFLTTRVIALDQDDWLKLAHLMMYIRGTIDLPLTLSANGTGMLKWYVYRWYGVHPNMRGHSGVGLSMGTGFPISSSTN